MPPSPNAQIEQAMAAVQCGDLPKAVDLLALILKTQPGNASLWFNRAALLQQLGRAEEAILDYDRALEGNPGDVEAWFNRGVACEAAGRAEDAVRSYDRVIALQARHPGARNNRGIALARLGRHAQALTDFQQALTLNPNDVKALYNSANALRALERPEEALAVYDRALAIEPRHADAHNNRALCLEELERPEEALREIDEALRLDRTASRVFNRANMLFALERPAEAVAALDEALQLSPEMIEARYAKALGLLTLGRFEEGWPLYELRWTIADAPAKPQIDAPLWLGRENITGKRVLLHAEQGFGDTIQFCRYAPLLAARGAHVTLRVQPELAPFLKEALSGAVEILSTGDPPPAVDYWIPLLSLPLAFGTRLETIPNTIPYLTADPARAAAWRTKIAGEGPLIGLVWRGGQILRLHRRRTIPPRLLAPLLDAPARFVSLQMDLAGDEERIFAEDKRLTHYGDAIKDFREQAALISACDLIISIDTGAAHLAGALGKPLWILLPTAADFRWLTERETSPWLPRARLFRQTRPGRWEDVIARVRAELDAAFPPRGQT